MNRTYDCPNCSGAVPFQSSIAVFAVCPFCQSMVVRRDVNVEAIGKMAQLPPDLSPLQIGAHGEFEGRAFTLLGRVRLAYDDGSWNEWYASFGDQRHGWVAEAQGFFMVSFEIDVPANVPKEPSMDPGHEIEIDGVAYHLADKKTSVCLGAEGELPFSAPPGRKAVSMDFTGAGGRFACAEYGEGGGRFFMGRYARFEELNFTGLRKVPGWSEETLEPQRGQTTSLQCPECGGVVMLRAAGFSMSATCGSCGSLIDTATPELSLIRRAKGRQKFEPVIPLGRRGVLFGVNYEVIGFQRVKDQYSGWFEYLLFNPWHGFAWLVTYNGHWSFVRRLLDRPVVKEAGLFRKNDSARFEGRAYPIFAAGDVSTAYVLGEFYWKVAVGHPAHVTDFICPPLILSREAYPGLGEETWSQGEYVEPEVIRQAFNLEDMREPTGRYLNQPNPYKERGRQLKWIVPLVALLLIVIQGMTVSAARKQQVFAGNYEYRAGMTNPMVVTEPFGMEGGNQSVEFVLGANVNNNWLELDIDLVRADTQQVVSSFSQGVEYYHGYEGGESWSEGSRRKKRLLSAVPGGRYYLTIDATAAPDIPVMPFTVTVVRDVAVWSNFLIALGVLLAYPIYCWARSSAFERARWMDSDYSPYMSASDDDDDEE